VSEERTKSTALESGGEDRRRRLLAFWDGGTSAVELREGATFVIGRSQSCDLQIDHASVSRRHAAWRCGPPDAVEDFGSANGTRLNGRRIPSGRRVPVEPGDTIEIGRAMLVVQGSAESRERAGDAPMGRVRRLIDLAAPTSMTVLLLGETGVGKDVWAEYLHRSSPRAAGPLVRVNCAALVDTLLESELFGHEKGAFTGASQAKPGLLEAARGGTIFLDEIGEMTLSTQAKLLVAVERREVLRLGSMRPRPIDARFIAATNRNLEARVAEGHFRQDLLFRLNGVTIRIPPLRERRDEIEELVGAFVDQACRDHGRAPVTVTDKALAAFRAQPYPGNIRELRALVERAVAFSERGVLDVTTVGFALEASAHDPAKRDLAPARLESEIDALERRRIVEALDRHDGNQTKTAEYLGMPRRTLVTRLTQYGLTRPRKTHKV
jgi:DNA-binding NtrC family response regulator